MRLLITGGGGFVGARLARTLLARGTLAGQPIDAIVLADQIAPPADLLADARVSARVGAAARPVRGAGRRGLRRRVPPGLGGVGRMRGRFRPGHALQPGQHARAARSAARAPAAPRCADAAGVLQLGGGIRPGRVGAAAAGGGRRHAAGAADQLRHAEAGVRAPDRRLHAQGLRRRPRGAADDGDGAPGPAQRRGLVLLQRHHPRAAGRAWNRSARSAPTCATRCRRRPARWPG